MGIEKILAVVVVIYLAIALPMQFLNYEAIGVCRQACSEQGFDIILGAVVKGSGTECRCLDSYTRSEKIVEI